MGICTSVSRGNKTVEAKSIKKRSENENITDENRINEQENKENKNNESLISKKSSKEDKEEKEDYPDIIISYLSNGKTEFEQTFKTKEMIKLVY